MKKINNNFLDCKYAEGKSMQKGKQKGKIMHEDTSFGHVHPSIGLLIHPFVYNQLVKIYEIRENQYNRIMNISKLQTSQQNGLSLG